MKDKVIKVFAWLRIIVVYVDLLGLKQYHMNTWNPVAWVLAIVVSILHGLAFMVETFIAIVRDALTASKRRQKVPQRGRQ